MNDEEPHDNLRTTLLRDLFGARLVDATEDRRDDGMCFVVLMFDNGGTLSFPVGDSPETGFTVDTL